MSTGGARTGAADDLATLYEVGEQSIQINRLEEAAWCFRRAASLDPIEALRFE